MTDEKRPYRKTRRAELEQETRLRITQSAVALHGTLGPVRTSIGAIAAHAGVRRSTVYRHFPDEEALFTACTAHWAAENPAPDLSAWRAIEDPDERLHQALRSLYAFYRDTRGILENVQRDAAISPVVEKMSAGFRAYFAAARTTLMAGRRARGHARRRLQASIGLALAFATWRSLAIEQGLDDDEAAELMCRAVASAAR
jgi:AcrR family transcriptional regulator